MGEAQTFSKRLHDITERRSILSEVERIQRELEQKKLSLMQLKRKSLRERWLMDGMPPSPGTEVDNPLYQTESKIQQLEQELESLQLQLARLENPKADLPAATGNQIKVVNGERKQQETQQIEEVKVSRVEVNDQPHGDTQKEQETVQPTNEDNLLHTVKVASHPTPAPRGKKCEIPNQAANQSSQGCTLENQDGHHEIQNAELVNLNEQNEKESLEHPDKPQKQEHLETENTEKHHHDQDAILEYICESPQPVNPDLAQLDNYLVTQVANQNDPVQNLSIDEQNENYSHQGQNKEKESSHPPELDQREEDKKQTRVESSEPQLVFKEYNQSQENVTKDEEQDQEPSNIVLEPLEDHIRDPTLLIQEENPEKNNESVSITHDQNEKSLPSSQIQNQEPVIIAEDQNQSYFLTSKDDNQDQSSALPAKGEDQTQESCLSTEEQTGDLVESADFISIPLQPSSELHQEVMELICESVDLNQLTEQPFYDQGQENMLPSKDQEDIPPVPAMDQNQEQISKDVIIPDLEQESSSADCMEKPTSPQPVHDTIPSSNSAEGSSSPECQPLLQKPQGTESHSAQGGNTAAPHEESKPIKKKSCDCCNVM